MIRVPPSKLTQTPNQIVLGFSDTKLYLLLSAKCDHTTDTEHATCLQQTNGLSLSQMGTIITIQFRLKPGFHSNAIACVAYVA